MKVAVDLSSLADNFSGIERYAANITKNLILNNNIDFILIFKGNIHPFFVDIINLKNVKMATLKPCNKLWFYQYRLPKAMKKFRADINLFLAFPPAIFFNKKNCIMTIHDMVCWDCPETMTLLSRMYFRASIKNAVNRVKSVITISKFSRDRILSKFPFLFDKIHIAYCGIDERFYVKNSIKPELLAKYNLPSKYILSLSTLEPRKNLVLLLKAYAKIYEHNKDIPDLVLAGRKGWKMDELFTDFKLVSEKVHFTGFIDDEDLPYVYAMSKLFVFPSKYEGFGIPPLEAMASGVPVLSSDAASLPEVLGDAAYYFENNNYLDLFNKLTEILNNDISGIKEREQLIGQAQKFSWEIEAKKLIKNLSDFIYEE